jgi:hypothetical protein
VPSCAKRRSRNVRRASSSTEGKRGRGLSWCGRCTPGVGQRCRADQSARRPYPQPHRGRRLHSGGNRLRALPRRRPPPRGEAWRRRRCSGGPDAGNGALPSHRCGQALRGTSVGAGAAGASSLDARI